MPSQPASNRPTRRPRSLYERNYRHLEDIIGRPLPDLQSGVVYRLRADGFMDLVVVELSADCDAFVEVPHDGPGEWSTDPADWPGFAGVEPVLLHEEDLPVDPLSDGAGGDRFDLAELGLAEVSCVRLTSAVAEGFPADPVSDGPDVDGVYGRGDAPR